MDATSKGKLNPKLDILPPETRKAFVFLSEQAWVGDYGWYLAGGTALALQAGHRRSVDLDFFTTESELNSNSVLGNFLHNPDWLTTFEEKGTVYGELFKAKISFIAYPFFIPRNEFVNYGSIKILHALDIAAMKIITISQRGRKRDFYDLYWCAKNLEPLEETIKRLKDQYPTVAHDYHHILKSLVYFTDAETDPEPEIFFTASWQEVKNYFEKEIPAITEKLVIGNS